VSKKSESVRLVAIVPEHVAKAIESRASSEHLSVSAYLRRLLADHVKGQRS
jgi:hypothetical protein